MAIGSALTAAGVLLLRLRPEASSSEAPTAEPAIASRLATWSSAPPTGLLTRYIAYAWAAPLTAAGILLGAASRSRPSLQEGVLLFADAGGLTERMLRWRGFAAATLGHVIIAVEQPNAALMRHELTHVRQAERLGPFFPPLYLLALARYGYRRNPFERAAYLAGRRGTKATVV